MFLYFKETTGDWVDEQKKRFVNLKGRENELFVARLMFRNSCSFKMGISYESVVKM